MIRKILGKIMFWKQEEEKVEKVYAYTFDPYTIMDIASENYNDLSMNMKYKLKNVPSEKVKTVRMGMNDLIRRKFLYGKPLPIDAKGDKVEDVFEEILFKVWEIAQNDESLKGFTPNNLIECPSCGFEAEPKTFVQKRKPTRRICPSCKSFCKIEE